MRLSQWLLLSCFLALGQTAVTQVSGPDAETSVAESDSPLIYILPIQEPIMPPLIHLVKRGIDEATEAGADLLVLDMNTDGGRVDVTEEIIGIISDFPGRKITYVNRRAFSAGAFISVATEQIYMSPESVIGAAAPIMMSPGGGSAQDMPSTVEAKMTSAVAALVRARAQEYGYNLEVIEAMIDKGKEMIIDGETLVEKGEILTLTNREAEKEYGDPATPLLSSGTFETLDDLIVHLGFAEATRVEITPTGAEKLASWINAISPVLMIIGILGIYLEFKTPGFGFPGIVGILALLLFFLGSHIGGLSGIEWMAVFFLGLILVAIELFVFPGTMILGLTGSALILVSLVMALVYEGPSAPTIPAFPDLRGPLREVGFSFFVTFILMIVLAKILPKTPFYSRLVSQTASGMQTVKKDQQEEANLVDSEGRSSSPLMPGGKAYFGDRLLDVTTQGEYLEKGQKVRIIRFSAGTAIVEKLPG